MAELSRNILVQPLWGQAIVRGTSSPLFRLGLILKTKKRNKNRFDPENEKKKLQILYFMLNLFNRHSNGLGQEIREVHFQKLVLVN